MRFQISDFRFQIISDSRFQVKTFTLAEARDMVRRGDICDMKTLVGLRLI